MINPDLESDLRSYAKRRNKKLFEQKIYDPLSQLFRWLITKQYSNIRFANVEDLQQLAMLRVIKEIPNYRVNKDSSAISFVRMLMTFEIGKHRKRIERRQNRHTDYNCNKDARTYSEAADPTIEQLAEHLENYKEFVPETKQKIISAIIEILRGSKSHNLCTKHFQIVRQIVQATGCSSYLAIQTIKEIRAMKFYS